MPAGRTRWTNVLAAVALVSYLASAVTTRPPRHRVLIPADRPIVVRPPMQVDVVDETGARGLRIPPGVGRGWCGEAGGSAVYRFYVPEGMRYVPWALCLWQGACTNAVYARFDGADRFVLGNDPVYGRWHWVRGPGVALSRGTHTLELSNHSDGIAIGRLLLLSDPTDRPDDRVPAVYDLFYDCFDGCDGGNITAWRRDASCWRLTEPAGEGRYDQRVLVGGCEGSGEPPLTSRYAAIGDTSWQDIEVLVSVNPQKAGPVGICFDFKGPDQCLAVRWRSEASDGTLDRVEAWRVSGGTSQLLGACAAPIAVGRWQEVGLRVEDGRLMVRIDGRLAGAIGVGGALNGPVALEVGPGAIVWFDDVHVRGMDVVGYVPSPAVEPKQAPRCSAG